MAVEWRHLIFGDVDSADYGIYISGDGVYNAPERDVEFVSVPGRNGDIAMDNGRYNNITVTYPAGTFAKTQEEFREKLSDFRNAILSQKGYQRLEDTYHPDEYRMGLYASGLEVSPVAYQQAGEFELTFNCKPQRWLSVGALPIPVDSGDVLQNPTMNESAPLLELKGHGVINLGGQIITVGEADQLGDYVVYRDLTLTPQEPIIVNRNLTEDSDTFTIGPGTISYIIVDANGTKFESVEGSYYAKADISTVGLIGVENRLIAHTIRVSYETTAEIETRIKVYAYVSGTLSGVELVITNGYVYHATTGELEYTYPQVSYEAISGYPQLNLNLSFANVFMQNSDITVHSTKSIETVDKYMDFDSGEAYGKLDGSIINLNKYVYLGSDLPTIKTGNTVVNYDSTITDFKLTPRWWKL